MIKYKYWREHCTTVLYHWSILLSRMLCGSENIPILL